MKLLQTELPFIKGIKFVKSKPLLFRLTFVPFLIGYYFLFKLVSQNWHQGFQDAQVTPMEAFLAMGDPFNATLPARLVNVTALEVLFNIPSNNTVDEFVTFDGFAALVGTHPTFFKFHLSIMPIVLLAILHVGILVTAFHTPSISILFNWSSTNYLKATHVYVSPKQGSGKDGICPILNEDGIRFVEFHKRTLLIDGDRISELPWPRDITAAKMLESKGLSDDDLKDLTIFPSNSLVVPVPSFSSLFVKQLLSPFFIFQVFCCLLWMLDDFASFPLMTIGMLAFMESTSVKQRLKNLNDVASFVPTAVNVTVHRNGKRISLSSDHLVPGDIYELPSKGHIPADGAVIEGIVVVDESMLTGETTSQIKTTLKEVSSDKTVDPENDRQLCVYSGTRIVKTDRALVYVLRTGFGTDQGSLLRAILFDSEGPISTNNKEYFIILLLLVVALCASWYVFREGVKSSFAPLPRLLLECMLIITSVVPPELPTQLSMTVNNSLTYLKKKFLFSTEPFRVPLAGRTKVFLADKTGTLTEDGTQLDGVFVDGKLSKIDTSLPPHTQYVLAGCHGVSNVDGKLLGEDMEVAVLNTLVHKVSLIDEIVLEPRLTIKILARHAFSSDLKRMSTIIKLSGKAHGKFLVMKGAPEVVKNFLETVPEDYEEQISKLVSKGHRVLALACAPLTADYETREEAEKTKLNFCGLLVLSTPLKPKTAETIALLRGADIRTVMVTGDNVYTAAAIAQQCGMCTGHVNVCSSIKGTILEGYNNAVTGDVLATLTDQDWNDDEIIDTISHITVFARTSPYQKQKVIAAFNKLSNNATMYVGDAANDVCALKEATCGVAIIETKDFKLSEKMLNANEEGEFEAFTTMNPFKLAKEARRRATISGRPVADEMKDLMTLASASRTNDMTVEDDGVAKMGDASIAAPFTAKTGRIQTSLHLIRQGRCTLVTTVQMYKILALQCLLTAYSQSVLTLAGVRFGDYQMTVSSLAASALLMSMTRAKPVKEITADKPPRSVFSPSVFVSLCIQGVVQLLVLAGLTEFVKRETGLGQEVASFTTKFTPNLLNTVVFHCLFWLQITIIIVNYVGRPFMQSFREYGAMKKSTIFSVLASTVLTLQLVPELNMMLKLVIMPPKIASAVAVVCVSQLFFCIAVEQLCRIFFRNN